MDTLEWNPATDKYLDVKYNKSNVFAGKKAAKEALQAEVGLDVSSSVPLFGYIGRLEEQKGVDILMKVRVNQMVYMMIMYIVCTKILLLMVCNIENDLCRPFPKRLHPVIVRWLSWVLERRRLKRWWSSWTKSFQGPRALLNSVPRLHT